ncbi:hypothetical protein G9A89_016845 [Geosiphon pyriformis]|nr:hypothetical protein G9A89_016845 [Geosiphon pyriformis]
MSSTFLNVQKSNSETISANFDGSNIRQIRKIAKPKTKSSKKQKSSKVESLSNSLPTFQRELYAVSNKSTIPGAISQFQPVRGRMSGFAIRDFRPITPSPVVKLKAITSSGENVDILNIDDSLFILHADLLARREKIFENAMTVLPFPKYKESLEEYEFKPMDNLIGNHVSSPLKIKDEKGEMGIYFIFSFSVRMAGKYKINFSLIRLGR